MGESPQSGPHKPSGTAKESKGLSRRVKLVVLALLALDGAVGGVAFQLTGRPSAPKSRNAPAECDEIVAVGLESSGIERTIEAYLPMELARAQVRGKRPAVVFLKGETGELARILNENPAKNVTYLGHGNVNGVGAVLSEASLESVRPAPGRTIRLTACLTGRRFAAELARRSGCDVQASENELDIPMGFRRVELVLTVLDFLGGIRRDSLLKANEGRGVDPDNAWFTYHPDGTKTPLRLPSAQTAPAAAR